MLLWCALGLVSGVVAKFIMPGKDKGGLITTTLLGIAGAFLGPYLGQMAGIAGLTTGFSVMGFVSAIIGAFVLLIAFRILRLLW